MEPAPMCDTKSESFAFVRSNFKQNVSCFWKSMAEALGAAMSSRTACTGIGHRRVYCVLFVVALQGRI